MRKTTYTITAEKTVAATAAPFGGSSVEPIIEWWFVWKRAPIMERITMAKTEMTMHDHAWTAPTTGFILVVCGVSKAGLKLSEMRRRRNGMVCDD